MYAAFFLLTKRLVLASVTFPGIQWSTCDTKPGPEKKSVKIPDLHLQARALKPSYPGEPEMSRMHVNSGESGVEILKLKCTRLRPSHFSCGVTGERSRRSQAHPGGAAVPVWSVHRRDDCNAEKILGILSTQDSYCTWIFLY